MQINNNGFQPLINIQIQSQAENAKRTFDQGKPVFEPTLAEIAKNELLYQLEAHGVAFNSEDLQFVGAREVWFSNPSLGYQIPGSFAAGDGSRTFFPLYSE